MKPQARIQTTIEILNLLKENNLPMDLMIGDYMRNRRFIGSKDRRDVVERLYHIVRHFARLGHILGGAGADDTPRARVLAYLKLYEGCDEKRLDDLFDGSKYAPETLSDEERTFVKSIEMSQFPAHVRVECPEQYRSSLEAYFGDYFEAEMAAMMESATLDLRVNVFVKSREEAQGSLAKDQVETEPTPYSPWGLRCNDKAFLSKTKAFNKGWVAIQDEGSQLIAHVCDAQPGMQVLDYCAGGGGKTLALAAAMSRKGRIVAMDNDARRLEKGRRRFKKSGLADIIEVRPLSEERHRKWLRRQKGTFDVVLLDVPCTGTGTWRRNPDMRWNTYGPGLAELVTTQSEILDKVADTVKPGGKLVYATCSLLPEENEQQIEAFLKRHDGFEVTPLPPHLTSPRRGEGYEGLSGEASAKQDLAEVGRGGDFMRLTPHRHNTDGFFAAVLTRKP